MLCAHPCTVVLQRAAGRHLISRGVLVPDALVAVQGCCTAPAQPPPDPRSPRPGAAGLVQDPVLHLGQLAALPHLRRRQHRGRRHRGALAGGGSPRGGPGGAVPLRRLRRSCPLPAVQRPRQAAGDAARAVRRVGQCLHAVLPVRRLQAWPPARGAAGEPPAAQPWRVSSEPEGLGSCPAPPLPRLRTVLST